MMIRRLIWVLVLAVSVVASCSEGKTFYVYSIVVKTLGKTRITEVRVFSKTPPFAFQFGGLSEGGERQYSDVEPREALSSGIVSWRLNGVKVEVPFVIDPPPPDMVERIRTSSVEVNGHVFTSTLKLMFEINPDEGTAKVFWYESKLPPLSPPKN